MKPAKILYSNKIRPEWRTDAVFFVGIFLFSVMGYVIALYLLIVGLQTKSIIIPGDDVSTFFNVTRYVCFFGVTSVALLFLFLFSSYLKGVKIYDDRLCVGWREYTFSNIDCIFVERYNKPARDEGTHIEETIVIKFIKPVGKKKYEVFFKGLDIFGCWHIYDFREFLVILGAKTKVKRDYGVLKENLGWQRWRVEFPPPDEENETG